jgi:hypothetical protein
MMLFIASTLAPPLTNPGPIMPPASAWGALMGRPIIAGIGSHNGFQKNGQDKPKRQNLRRYHLLADGLCSIDTD